MAARPIIQSLLDTDFYKFTMGQFVWRRYADVQVRYALTNRTRTVHIAETVDEAELRDELDHARTLRFAPSELEYLRGITNEGRAMFSPMYLEFLEKLQLPEYSLERHSGSFSLEFSGTWAEAIYWETIALSIVNELYFRGVLAHNGKSVKDAMAIGMQRLMDKIAILAQRPDIRFSDFGTRRRFSSAWHMQTIETLCRTLDSWHFLGTSNVWAARHFSVTPMGTVAHELQMILSGANADESLAAVQNQLLDEWWEEYGYGLSIFLPDTLGSDFFIRNLTTERLRSWKGFRWDSGDPFVFARNVIELYRRNAINSKQKILIPSDGLDLILITHLQDALGGEITLSYGWGTDLTNDLGLETPSLVVKPVEANGRQLVKLSDNLAKAIGRPADIERYRSLTGYNSTYNVSPRC